MDLSDDWKGLGLEPKSLQIYQQKPPPKLKCREKINKTQNRISSNHCGTITKGITGIMGLHKAKKEKRKRGSI